MCAAAVVACNQLFSIEEPTLADSGGSGGSTTQGLGGDGGSGVDATLSGGGSENGGSTTEETSMGGTTTTAGGTGGDASGGTTSMGGSTSSGGTGGTPSTNGTGGTPSTGGSGGTTSSGGSATTTSVTTTSVTTTSVTTASVTTASVTTASVTTGVVIPPDPCEGEDLHGPALVEIPEGTGVIGTGVVEDNASPVINPDFDVFCIDETEVTVSDYQECVDDGGACDPPIDDLPGECPEDPPRPGNHPVGCVDWARADDYCRWAGKRLPTEQEWEYAARGTEGRPYPWGDQPLTEDRLNWNSVVGLTTPVKSHPDGTTPEGVYDMAGNVWEWTASTWCSDYSDAPDECDPTIHVPRGGSYISIDRFVSPSYRDADNQPDQRFGFRCAFGPVN